MKSVLQNNDIKLCPTHNEGKSIKEQYVIAERFIRTLKNKTCVY